MNLILWIAVVCGCLFPQLCFAVLGQDFASVQKVQKALRAKRLSPSESPPNSSLQKPSSTTPTWTVQTMEADGNTIKEFLNKDGVVFAVTWKGIKKPNLALLLGSYYEEFSAAEQKQIEKEKQISRESRRKNHVRLNETKTSQIKVQRSGHMRGVRGKAFIPSLLPTELNEGDITP